MRATRLDLELSRHGVPTTPWVMPAIYVRLRQHIAPAWTDDFVEQGEPYTTFVNASGTPIP